MNETALRVRFAETDQMGIAHHSAYVVWLEAARVEWLRLRGISYRRLEEEGVSLAVSSVHVDYRSAARFDDELLISAYMTEARTRRFRFDYRVERPADGALLALAATVHTPIDRSGRAIRLPADWFDRLAGLVEALPDDSEATPQDGRREAGGL